MNFVSVIAREEKRGELFSRTERVMLSVLCLNRFPDKESRIQRRARPEKLLE
jgi:hypothetical protein